MAEAIAAYLRHAITLTQLVDRVENAVMDTDFEERNAALFNAVVARLGVADVRVFGHG